VLGVHFLPVASSFFKMSIVFYVFCRHFFLCELSFCTDMLLLSISTSRKRTTELSLMQMLVWIHSDVPGIVELIVVTIYVLHARQSVSDMGSYISWL